MHLASARQKHGRMGDGQKVITIVHSEHSSGELKMEQVIVLAYVTL